VKYNQDKGILAKLVISIIYLLEGRGQVSMNRSHYSMAYLCSETALVCKIT